MTGASWQAVPLIAVVLAAALVTLVLRVAAPGPAATGTTAIRPGGRAGPAARAQRVGLAAGRRGLLSVSPVSRSRCGC